MSQNFHTQTMPQRGLYGITTAKLFQDPDLTAVRQALDAGLSLLQYRDKQALPEQKTAQVAQLMELCALYHCPLIINDDIELCIHSGAQGVHLGQGDGSIAEARHRLGESSIIGATCHNSIALAQNAVLEGCSYVAFGRFFPSNSKQSAPPAELSVLIQAKQRLAVPCIAIGGINIDNAQAVLDCGADMIALIDGLFGQTDIRATINAFRQLNWNP